MSVCISSHGEFGSHTHTVDPLVCDLCSVFDEDGARRRIAVLEGEIRKLEPRPGDVLLVRAAFTATWLPTEDAFRKVVGEKVSVLFLAPDVDAELADREAIAAAFDSFAELIDSWPANGPRLSPSVFSTMARERAADLRGGE